MSEELSPQLLTALQGTADAVVVLQVTCQQQPHPEWITLPPRGKKGQKSLCPWTSLPASTLRDLIRESRRSEHRIITRQRRKPGAEKGILLVHYESLMAFIGSWKEWEPGPEPQN